MTDGGVSVIVPFHRGARELGELLQSLAEQDYVGPWQVVAVDNRSADECRAVAIRFSSVMELTIVDAPVWSNPAYARNVGAESASGDKLLFVDADDQVAPGYVSAMAGALDEHAFVTSRVDSVSLNPDWVRLAHGPPWQEDGIQAFLGFLPGAGANIGIRRRLFERIGGFSDEFHGSEDIAFSWAVQLESGERLHFVKDALYRYRYRSTYRGLFRQGANWGRDHARLFRRFRTLGMPPRSLGEAATEWMAVLSGFLLPGHDRPALVVRFGYCVGRLAGSIRYGVRYL